jgi:PAS domain S-box-containing protein
MNRQIKAMTKKSSFAEKAVLETLLQATFDSTLVIDATGTILAANLLSVQSFGRAGENLIGNCLYDLLPLNQQLITQAIVEDVVQTGQPREFETQRCGCYLAAHLYPVVQGESIKTLVLCERDITAQKHLQDPFNLYQSDDHDSVSNLNDFLTETPRTLTVESANSSASLNLAEQILNTLPNRLYLYDVAHERPLYINQAMSVLLGEPNAQICAMDHQFLSNLVHPEDLEQWLNCQEQLAQTKDRDFVEFEGRILDAKGEWRWYLHRQMVFSRTRNGRIQQILGIAEDITERKQQELALEKSQQMLQWAIDHIPQAIFWKDQNLIYLGCNQRFAENVGFNSVNEVIGKTDYQLNFTPAQADFSRQCDQGVMENNQAQYHVVIHHTPPTGKTLWLDTSKVPLHDAFGNVIGVLGTYEDITERRQMEQALQASEERFRLLVEGVREYAICMLDVSGTVISWNTGAQRITGYHANEIIGQNFACFYELQDRQWGKPAQQLNACATAGRFEDEGWRVRKDGSKFWASVSITALHNDQGELRGFAKVLRDITERRQAEEALQKANEDLGLTIEVRTTELRVTIEQLHQEIGKRIQAEVESRQSEQKYRSVVDNLKEVIFQTDEVGLWTFLNPAWQEITGFSVAESLDKLFIQFVHPEDRQRYLEQLQPLLTRQQNYFWQEIRYLHKQQGYRWLEVFARLTLDDQGHFTGTTGTLNDITERKQAEAALKDSEERFRRAFEDVATGMALVKLDGQFLKVNHALCQMLGYSEATLMAMTFSEITHPDDLQNSLEFQHQAQAGQVVCQQLEQRCLHQQGHTVWTQLTTSLMQDDVGQPLYQVCQMQDITERKQAEAALKESELQFRQLAENVDEVFWIVTPDLSRLIYVSPMYEQIWGRSCEQLYHLPLSRLKAIHPEDHERVRTAIKTARRKLKRTHSIKSLWNEEYRIIQPDGAIRWIWERCFPVYNEAGQVDRLCGVAKDITGRKQAEEELRKALSQEKELSELRSRFVTMVSHEFRTPLATILSSADLLEYYLEQWPSEKTEKKLEHLSRIQTAAVHMNQLLNDVLIIGKTDAGKLCVNLASVNLEIFCSELVEEFQIIAQNSHTLIFIHHPLELSDTGNNFCRCHQAWIDEKLLRQILSNLLSNAIKYSPQGGSIQFILTCQNTQLQIQIQDPGIGIPLEDQPQLFEVFHRAKNVGDIPGTGLGLAIVKRAVDALQGKITVESEVGMGTIMTLTLPFTHRSQYEENSSD